MTDTNKSYLQKCHWKGCKTKIQVEQLSNNSFFYTVGWCDVHQNAFRIYTELEKKFCKKNHIDWPIGSLSYKKHKKALDELHELAGHRAANICKICNKKPFSEHTEDEVFMCRKKYLRSGQIWD